MRLLLQHPAEEQRPEHAPHENRRDVDPVGDGHRLKAQQHIAHHAASESDEHGSEERAEDRGVAAAGDGRTEQTVHGHDGDVEPQREGLSNGGLSQDVHHAERFIPARAGHTTGVSGVRDPLQGLRTA